MPADFTHLVLTRFNTAIDYAPSELRLNTEWLRGRLSLFERYCLPSMAGQASAQFRWVVFFDAASPRWLKDQIESYGSLMTPIYIDGVATDAVIARRIAEAGLASSEYLVTTRLDNDDALARTHLAYVQREFRRQEREFVAFPLGMQYFRGHLYTVCWRANPFLSLIERVQNHNRFTTVFCVPHYRVRESGDLRLLIRGPQWLQVLHSSNIRNGLRGLPRMKSTSHEDFNVAWPEVNPDDSFVRRLGWSASACGRLAATFMHKTMARLG